ncbi:hypothetical protein [Euzebya sp.]|uniref:hypothetical protein n=1 Tax=Euzebya sp. TaxID=1971409 RepID=UPI003519B3E2
MRSTATPSGRAAISAPEAKLATAGALGALAAALPAGAVALAVVPAADALAVALGSALVAVLALSALPLYRMGARAGAARTDVVVTMALVALAQRLMLGVAVLAALWRLTDLPMRALGAGVAVGLVASVAAEMVAAARDPRFFWVDAAAGGRRGPLNPTGTERQHA